MLARLLLSVLLLAAFSDHASAVDLTFSQRRCLADIGRAGGTFFKDTTRALRKCRSQIAKGTLSAGTDCALEPRTASRINKAAARVRDKIAGRCTASLVSSLSFGGQCYGVETIPDLANCLTDTHEERANELIEAVYGSNGKLGPGRRRCQGGTAKEAEKVAVKKQDLLRKCKDDIAARRLRQDTDCEAHVEPTLAKVRDQARSKVQAACPDSLVAAMDWGTACQGIAANSSLAACALGVYEQGIDALHTAAYGGEGGASGGGAATVVEITDGADCVEGPLSRCRVGDYLLKNEKIRVVIQKTGRNLLAVGTYGGQIIDADLVRAPGEPDRDHFEEAALHMNFENGPRYTDLVVINDGTDGAAAVLRATGVDDLHDFVNPSAVVTDFGFALPASADDTDLPVEITTDYSLSPGANYVDVRTTLTNTSANVVAMYMGNYLAPSGQVETFQPAYGFGEPLIGMPCPAARNPCNLFAFGAFGDADGVSYGMVHDIPGSSSFSTSGVAVSLLGTSTLFALIGVAPANFVLQPAGSPGDQLEVRHQFVVGDGSVASILEARNEIQFVPTGTIEGTATVGGVPTAGVRVVVLGDAAGAPSGLARNVVTHTITDAAGAYAVDVAPGTYQIAAGLDGHPYEGGGSTPLEHTVAVTAYQSATQNLALTEAATAEVTITDQNGSPIAARVTFVGFDSSPQVLNTQSVLGLINNTTGYFRDPEQDTRFPHGIAAVFFVDQAGQSGPLAVEPGSYRLYISHGPEYSVATADVTLTSGATTPISAQLARVVDTSGFVSGDLHVHSIDSPDSKVSRRERIHAMLAEGVEFFTPTDHESVQDFTSDIAALGAGALIGTAPGSEITTFDYGHFNAWPLTRDPAKPNGGGIDHGGAAAPGMDFPAYGNYSLTPAEIIAAAHADPGTDTVQINHFYSFMGLGQSGLAIDTGQSPPQSAVPGTVRRLDPAIPNYFSADFDALELLIESGRGQIFGNFYGRNLGDWFNMTNQGIVKTAVANSDTHRRVRTLSGIPRTYIASPTDDPSALSAIADTLSANVNAGRAIGTNSLFFSVMTHADSTDQTGGLALGLPLEIATTDGAVDITVEIQSPKYAEFDRVEFYVNPVTTRTVTQKNSGDPAVDPVDVTTYGVEADYVHSAGTDFTVSEVVVDAGIPGASRWEASTTLSLVGLTEDVWVVVVVRGSDHLSRPLFPVVPFDLNAGSNGTLAELVDGNLGEAGVPALAFSNPLFVDVDGGGWSSPGVAWTQ